ncbi:MAG: hypothetical protein NTW19_04770 [Planctomycetota bacterium]|nr:hypothetical protein [Planctomycetota bacterium]
MNALLHSMTQVWSDPARTHGMLVHFPIVAATLGVLFVFALMFTGGRSPGMRWATVLLYLAGAVAGYLAMVTGHRAGGEAATSLSDAAQQLLEKHEELGEKAWIFLLVTGFFAAFTSFNMVSVRTTMVVLSVLTALFTAGWVSVTGFYGGELVYGHSVGTSHPSAVIVATQPAEATTTKSTTSAATNPATENTHVATPAMPSAATSPAAKPHTGKASDKPTEKGSHGGSGKLGERARKPPAATQPDDGPHAETDVPMNPPPTGDDEKPGEVK